MATNVGVVNKRQISSILFMDTREINKGVIDLEGEIGLDTLFMEGRRYKAVDQANYHNFTQDNVLVVPQFTAVAGSGTATITVTINGTGFVRTGDKWLFANGKVGMINSAITTAAGQDSFTLTSVDGTNLTAVVGDKISANGLVVGEKSKAVDPISYAQTKYFNQIEILADTLSMTDIQMKSTVEVGDGYYMYTQAAAQAKSFKLKLNASLTTGVKSINQYGSATPSLVDRDGNSVQTTGGVFNEITTYGVAATVAAKPVIAMSDVDALLDTLLSVKAPSDYIQLNPDKVYRKYDDLFKGLTTANYLPAAKLSLDGNEINLNVRKFMKGKFSIEFGANPLGDHPELFNYAGGPLFGKCAMGFPKDKIKTVGSNGGAEINPRVGIRYMANPMASKFQGTEYVKEFQTGGLATPQQGSEQVLNIHWLSKQGAEVLGAKQMYYQQVLV